MAPDNGGVLKSLFPRPRRLSCGIVVLAPTRELLLCHVTGQRHWDLPKGGLHPGETPRQAALRETVEETSLVFAEEGLIELGRFAYTAKKDLHLFATLSERFDPRCLHCDSTFVERGSSRMLPEMDGFGWFAFERIAEVCTARLSALLLGPAIGLAATFDSAIASRLERHAA
jgi:8-oxo-dGTP pyrophosphatase MutT (NUDIX family)